MKIQENIEIQVTSSNYDYLYQSGYKDIDYGDILNISTKLLPDSSRKMVDVYCDKCNKVDKLQYRNTLKKEKYLCSCCSKFCNDGFNNYNFSKSEIYTEFGWRLLDTIMVGDNIYVIKDNHFILDTVINIDKKVFISKIIETGKLSIHFNKSNRFFIRGQDKRFKLKESDTLGDKDFLINRIKLDDFKDDKYIKISDYKFNKALWIRFMGFYISEGYCTFDGINNKVCIVQKNKNYIDILRRIILELNLNYKEYNYGGIVNFNIYDSVLFEHLSILGNNLEKYIPSYIKNSNLENISLFLDYLVCNSEKDSRYFITSSIRLRDDLEYLFYKIGSSTIIENRKLLSGDKYVVKESLAEGRYLDKRVMEITDGIKEDYVKIETSGHFLIRQQKNKQFWTY